MSAAVQLTCNLMNVPHRNGAPAISVAYALSAADPQEARAAFAEVANEIGTQYSLGYYPSNKLRNGQFRQIKVELRNVKDARARAREGYYAPKESKQ